ncbi:SSS family solute:Na+ symporter [Tamaricihabitans halophyticus]|uniref:Sodium/proline symporter n=1 Tax=Tamaricihabitans halophyticus TaxID=1262583 RepID=A0A4R2QFL8_9PSEU|nr:sodium/proline symporter [Tamaricihabitans halophyticus]TCP47857.1 SSS family solute:Na+ symporter [Tamaricihabitans halophyticus]
MSFELVFLLTLFVFLAITCYEGLRSYRANKSEQDFFVAGRKVGPWIGGASIAATQMSAGTFVGTVGIHYVTGASFMWGWAGIWVAFLVSAYVIAPRLRRYAHERNALTFPDFIADRFGGKVPRAVVSVLLVLSYLVFISAQYQAGGIILETVFGIPFVWGAAILMVVIVGYTVIGGMSAVVRTDFLQQITMAVGVAVGLPLLISHAGGMSTLTQSLPEVSVDFIGWGFGGAEIAGFWLGFGFAALCAPYLLIRYYSMPDDQTCRRASGVALLFVLLTGICIAIAGMVMRFLYPNLSISDAASTILASEVLPPFLGALLLTAVIMAVLSTVDSVLLVAGPAISHDIYTALLRPNTPERTRTRINRIATVVIGVLPLLLTLQELDIVQFVVLSYAALLASTITAAVLLGLYWKRATKVGAMCSMLAGFAVCLLWYLLGSPAVEPVVPGILASFTGMIAGSLLSRPVPPAELEVFFGPDRTTRTPASAVAGR